MFRRILILCGVCTALAGCSPALNWREVRFGPAGLKLMLPCKPDHANRPEVLAGQAVHMEMIGCEADGSLFALSMVDAGAPAQVADMLANWQKGMLAVMGADTGSGLQAAPYRLKGAADSPAPVLWTVAGKRPEGGAVQARAVWFVQGTRLYHAVVYADRLRQEAVDPFLTGIELP